MLQFEKHGIFCSRRDVKNHTFQKGDINVETNIILCNYFAICTKTMHTKGLYNLVCLFQHFQYKHDPIPITEEAKSRHLTE